MKVFVPTAIQAKIGRDVRGYDPSLLVNPDDVSIAENGIRYFMDGALVGMWRALQAHRVVGVLKENPDAIAIEPSWDGSFVKIENSAATWAETQSNNGFFVFAPILLAYDSDRPRYLVRGRDPSMANGNAFAIVLAPGQAHMVRQMANVSESGG